MPFHSAKKKRIISCLLTDWNFSPKTSLTFTVLHYCLKWSKHNRELSFSVHTPSEVCGFVKVEVMSFKNKNVGGSFLLTQVKSAICGATLKDEQQFLPRFKGTLKFCGFCRLWLNICCLSMRFKTSVECVFTEIAVARGIITSLLLFCNSWRRFRGNACTWKMGQLKMVFSRNLKLMKLND